ncbi:MAG: LON peptidase substrate-binding domain-containing protein [Hyphomicrobiaceae bacterium]
MATIDRYRFPTDLPREVALFPLRGAILLPRVTLPLNVFEPRYLAMVDDCLRGSRLIGIIQPDQSANETLTSGLSSGGTSESPGGKSIALQRVGCAGRITAYQELDDGRILITLTGISRFVLSGETSHTAPYRTGICDFAPFANDLTPSLGEGDVDRDALLKVLKAYLAANNLNTDWNAITKSSTEFLVNALSVMSPYGPVEKQALLESETLKSRSEVLIALAEMDLAANGSAGGRMQ